MKRLHPVLLGLAVCAGTVWLQGCAQLPALAGRQPSSAFEDTASTRLGQAIAPRVQAHGALSGVFALPHGREAFAARLLLAEAAERSLDVQYYIWRDDLSGTLLFEALHRAAERGVRVRLLLDDNNTKGLDPILAALDAHPNIEVRLFNPTRFRQWRVLGFLTDFARLNRRMHNKSFTVDNQATIVGGRNVGDEYFGVGDGLMFADLDVLAVGPAVGQVSRDFDRYWASDSSYPADRLLPPARPQAIEALAAAASAVERDPAAAEYMQAVAQLPFVRDLQVGELRLQWARTRLVSDDPAKALGQAPDGRLLLDRLTDLLESPVRELDLVSPYFVPGQTGVEAFAALARRGVRIRVLTNALEATDVPAVHAGYAKRRQPLLEAGVALFEMKRTLEGLPQAGPRSAGRAGPARRSDEPQRPGRSAGAGGPGGSGSTGGSSGVGSSEASLHAKTFAVDRARVFIGSFNFDPRSANLNTELGFVIESPVLARSVAEVFDQRMPARAYEVRRSRSGALQWIEQADGQTIVHDEEPGTGWWKRLGVRILSVLPIDWLL